MVKIQSHSQIHPIDQGSVATKKADSRNEKVAGVAPKMTVEQMVAEKEAEIKNAVKEMRFGVDVDKAPDLVVRISRAYKDLQGLDQEVDKADTGLHKRIEKALNKCLKALDVQTGLQSLDSLYRYGLEVDREMVSRWLYRSELALEVPRLQLEYSQTSSSEVEREDFLAEEVPKRMKELADLKAGRPVKLDLARYPSVGTDLDALGRFAFMDRTTPFQKALHKISQDQPGQKRIVCTKQELALLEEGLKQACEAMRKVQKGLNWHEQGTLPARRMRNALNRLEAGLKEVERQKSLLYADTLKHDVNHYLTVTAGVSTSGWVSEDQVSGKLRGFQASINKEMRDPVVQKTKETLLAKIAGASKRFENPEYRKAKIEKNIRALKNLCGERIPFTKHLQEAMRLAMNDPQINRQIEGLIGRYRTDNRTELTPSGVFEIIKSLEIAKGQSSDPKDQKILGWAIGKLSLAALHLIKAQVKEYSLLAKDAGRKTLQIEKEFNARLEAQKTLLNSFNEGLLVGSPKTLRERIQKGKQSLIDKVDVALKRFESTEYRFGKVKQNFAALQSQFGKKALSTKAWDALRLSMEVPEVNEMMEAILAEREGVKGKPLTDVELLKLSEALMIGKKSLMDEVVKVKENAGFFRVQIQNQFGPVLDEIMMLKKGMFKKELEKSPEPIKKAVRALQDLMGAKFPLNINLQFAFLRALQAEVPFAKGKIKGVEASNYVDAMNMMLARASEMQKEKMGNIDKQFAIDMRNQMAVLLEMPSVVIHEAYISGLMDLMRIFLMKSGFTPNTQLVTDAIEGALNTDSASKEYVRQKANLEFYKKEETLAALTDDERRLAKQGYISTAYDGVWGKTSWKKENNPNGLYLTWEGGFALPGMKEPQLQTLAIDLTDFGKLPPRAENHLLECFAKCVRSKDNLDQIAQAFRVGDAELLPEGLKPFFIADEGFLWKHCLSLSPKGKPLYEILMAKVGSFDEDVDKPLLKSFFALGS